ncbi:uncharacterized protein [Drosophila bipectinata]|uniref:uncharacterized protein n=1 Tax=Drosophila bipectinata TaxID=42026 RepID=UPI0038B3EAC4
MTEVSSVGCQTETRTGRGIILEDVSESEIGVDTSSRSGSEDELEPKQERKHEPVQDAEIETEQDPDLDEEEAEDLEQARPTASGSQTGSIYDRTLRRDDLWLSLHHFQAGEEVRLLCLFSHLCSLTAVRQRRAGLEMCFSSRENLQRGRLLAKRLVASRMQLKWHVGRLNGIPNATGNDSSVGGAGASEPAGRLGVLSRLRRAFLNYFQHT